MHRYRVFGRHLESDLSFPELEEASGVAEAPPLRLQIVSGPPPPLPPPESLLGEMVIGKGIPVRLYRTADQSLRLTFDDSGSFEVTADRIQWWPGADRVMEACRVDAKGRAIPLALHLGGLLCLHAGGARVGEGVLAFAGPKRAGKSTLTAALVARGAHFLTDDVLAVDPARRPPIAFPGFGAFRLWDDSAGELALPTEYRAPGLGGKWNVRASGIPPETVETAPLAALYLLSPMSPEGAEPPSRRRLPESEAAMAILANAKNVELLGRVERATLFDWAAGVAAALPVFELRIPRDLQRLGAVADLVLGWHGAGAG